MQHHFYITKGSSCLLLLLLFCLYSCSKDENTSDLLQLNVSPYQIQIPLIGGEQQVTIYSGKDWTATTKQDWIELSPLSGKTGTSKITIKVKVNDYANERTGRVSIQSGKEVKNISVIQEAQKELFFPLSFYQTTYGGEMRAPASKGGVAYEMKNDKQVEWIELRDTKDNSQLLNILPNESGTDRCEVIYYREKGTSEWKELLIAQVSGEEKGGFLCLKNFKINNIRATIDYTNKQYYIPVDMDKDVPSTVKVEFEGLGVDFIQIGDKIINSGESVSLSALKANSSMDIRVHNKLATEANLRKLIVTGVPIVEVIAPEGIVDEPKRPCEFVLTDPKGRTNGSVVRFESRGGIEIRGAGAQRYDKKAYGFKLKDATGEDMDAKLLGMREDQSWILDAMWLDCAKMRNRVCFDIWNDFHTLYYIDREPKAISATHGYPVEMFLDGTYHGLYILSDRIDRKQLKLKKQGGYLYKGGEWTDECRMQGITSPYDNSKLAWQGFDSEHPDVVGESDFKYLSDLIDFYGNASESDFAAHMEERLDTQSLVDYFIFINLLMAYDNTGRNVFWAIYDINGADRNKFLVLPWDLDGTLGRTWDANKLNPEKGHGFDNGLIFRPDANSNYFRPFERIMKENPNNIKQRIYERFMEVKDKALSPENMAKKVDYYKRQIVESGALERDRQKWSGKWMYGYANPNEEAEFMKTWYEKRLRYLEKMFQNL